MRASISLAPALCRCRARRSVATRAPACLRAARRETAAAVVRSVFEEQHKKKDELREQLIQKQRAYQAYFYGRILLFLVAIGCVAYSAYFAATVRRRRRRRDRSHARRARSRVPLGNGGGAGGGGEAQATVSGGPCLGRRRRGSTDDDNDDVARARTSEVWWESL